MVNHGTIWNNGGTYNSFAIGGMNFAFLENDGLIVSEAPNGIAEAVWVGSRGDRITNSGRIFAIASYNASAIAHWDPGVTVTNTGTIAAYTHSPAAGADAGGAAAIVMYNGGRILNGASGSILAEGPSATAIIFTYGDPIDTGVPQIRNAGLIEAYAFGGSIDLSGSRRRQGLTRRCGSRIRELFAPTSHISVVRNTAFRRRSNPGTRSSTWPAD